MSANTKTKTIRFTAPPDECFALGLKKQNSLFGRSRVRRCWSPSSWFEVRSVKNAVKQNAGQAENKRKTYLVLASLQQLRKIVLLRSPGWHSSKPDTKRAQARRGYEAGHCALCFLLD